MKKQRDFSVAETDRIIAMAWEDRTPFDAIKAQFAISEGEVIEIMRQNMKLGSFKMWRARVQGRATKHAQKSHGVTAFKSRMQKEIALNKISKR